MRHLLFYAGMANDKETEQIGLAISTDGVEFARVGGDGLLIGVDPLTEWRSRRTCNPTVVATPDGWTMYFQGVGGAALDTTIGRATSSDGLSWEVAADPCISSGQIDDPRRDASARAMVFEPSVLATDGGWSMWLMYSSSTHASNSLLRAESIDGETWQVEQRPVMRGSDYGYYRLHYPQVVQERSGYRIFFTLRSRRTHADSIWTAESLDGTEWRRARKVAGRSGLPVVGSRPGRVAGALDLLADGLVRRVSSRRGERNLLGISHPHVLVSGSEPARMYFHNDNVGRRGRWLDIGVGDYDPRRGLLHRRSVLRPSEDRNAWDSYFVADPFVVESA